MSRIKTIGRVVAVMAVMLFLLLPVSGFCNVLIIPNGTIEIDEEAFSGCSLAVEVQIPDSVKTIGENAFAGCSEAFLIRCGADSPAVEYATSNQMDYQAETQYRALIIGQNYTGTDYALQGPNADISAISWCLRSLPRTAYSVRTEKNLSANEITGAIQSFFGGANARDVSLFYYSGHGDVYGNLIGADNRFSTLSPTELRTVLDQIPGRKIVIVDACYSGKLIEEKAQKGVMLRSRAEDPEITVNSSEFVSSFQNAFKPRNRGALNADQYYVITAAREDETSAEGMISSGNSSRHMGYFTYCFCLGRG